LTSPASGARRAPLAEVFGHFLCRDADVGNRLAQRLFRNAELLDPVVDFDRLGDAEK